MLRRDWRESESDTIKLEGDEHKALEVVLRSLHGTLDELRLEGITIADTWHVTMACDKYGIEYLTLQDWFGRWYEVAKSRRVYGREFCEKVMFPCYAFDHAAGFQEATKLLVYSSERHVSEMNPTDIHRMHCPPRVLQQLNAARGRIRSIINQGLLDRASLLVRWGGCDCKEKTLYEYHRELERIKVWPIEAKMRGASVNQMISRLREFDEQNMKPFVDVATGVEKVCPSCDADWDEITSEVADNVRKHFDGPCLDCMGRSRNLHLGRDKDQEYWDYTKRGWGKGENCRVEHGEPSWVFSFMGRREKRGLIAD